MIWERVLKPAPKKIIFLSFNFVLFALFSFEKRSGERSLTSFEMTDIVIPSVRLCENSQPVFLLSEEGEESKNLIFE